MSNVVKYAYMHSPKAYKFDEFIYEFEKSGDHTSLWSITSIYQSIDFCGALGNVNVYCFWKLSTILVFRIEDKNFSCNDDKCKMVYESLKILVNS